MGFLTKSFCKVIGKEFLFRRWFSKNDIDLKGEEKARS